MKWLVQHASVWALCTLALAAGCTTISSDLDAATTLYRDARYEMVERWTQALAPECPVMSDAERLRYQYLSGMTAYRLGQPDLALHHLLLAAVLAQRAPTTLEATDQALMERTLDELQQAYSRRRG